MRNTILIILNGKPVILFLSLFIGCSHPHPFYDNNTIKPKPSINLNIISQLHIPSDDGQQGIATDGKFIFIQNSQQLFKYDLNGKLLISVEVIFKIANNYLNMTSTENFLFPLRSYSK